MDEGEEVKTGGEVVVEEEGTVVAPACRALRAAEVEADGVAAALRLQCGLQQRVGLVGRELYDEWTVLIACLQHAALVGGVVDEAVAVDHLGVAEGGTQATAEEAEGQVRDAHHRGDHRSALGEEGEEQAATSTKDAQGMIAGRERIGDGERKVGRWKGRKQGRRT